MNNILSKIITGKIGRAQRIVFYAPEGFGKSLLASKFPSPLFFDVEDSTSQMDVQRLTSADIPTLAAMELAVDAIVKSRICKTLVVDTFDWTEEQAASELCAKHEVETIEEVAGGFGKGYNFLTTRITLLLRKLDTLIAAGINVLLLVHSTVVKFDPPDGAGAFDRYELKLYKDRKGGKGTASLIKEWADMVLFGNYRTQIAEKTVGKNTTYKGVGGKERMMFCSRTSGWDAKNRHGMPDSLRWGDNAELAIAAIEKAFKSVNAPWLISAPMEQILGRGTRVSAEATTNTADSRVSLAVECEKVNGSEFSERKSKKSPDAPLEISADEIPMVSKEDEDFLRICEPVRAEAIEYLRSSGKIGLTAGLASVPMAYKLRVLNNPAGFLNVVKGAAK